MSAEAVAGIIVTAIQTIASIIPAWYQSPATRPCAPCPRPRRASDAGRKSAAPAYQNAPAENTTTCGSAGAANGQGMATIAPLMQRCSRFETRSGTSRPLTTRPANQRLSAAKTTVATEAVSGVPIVTRALYSL